MKEWTEIYEQLRGTFAQRAGFVPSEGCDSAVRLYALAAELQSLLMQADWVLDQSFPQTAQGTYLDYHAETRGITRGAAEKAAGVIRFAAADKVTAACPIEKGTVCMTAEGVRFETTEDAAIAVGSQWADVPAQAVEAGAGGNVIAGTVTLLSAMPVGVVQCTNPAAFSGGCDAESDETLRGRVLASYQRLPNGANAAYYEQEAMRYPGVAAAKAVGRARGIGTVNVVIATHAGVPDAALLAAVETDLQKKREIAVDVKVLAPTVETVAVTAALKAAPGYTFAEVKAGAQSALEMLFTGGLLGKSVTTARLLTLLCGVEGVENVHLTAPAADVAVDATELPMLGTVTLSELTEA
ncbi:baseplate J/gp47 family protein [Oscillibacter sp. MSJ-31]|uniref:baseplate J/gp47 family protein n=1 Tax=Oscillibacter sp. MSJ-31 TaxID=2841526 RepID=UPI001C11A409|nr:baseplate J/gp47 family protein [Oscillibacter sp. MSJ-31]MBU5457079.1 baseplate J/gp47 family protein [Oscillibacter sp. MSJ-31]